MPVINEFQLGTTVRLSATFEDFNALPTTPDVGSTRLTMYGPLLAELLFVIPEAGVTAGPGDGEVQWDWVPTAIGTYTYEWYGLIDGKPSTIRRQVKVVEV